MATLNKCTKISILSLCLAFLCVSVAEPVLAKRSNDPEMFQAAYEQAGVYRAWDYATGSDSVIVAVVDNGFDTFHPDLFQNVWQNTREIPDNNVDDDHNGYVDDVWGWNFVDNDNDPRPDVSALTQEERDEKIYNHGTFVAGIIGAIGNNNRDGVGVNWKVKLMNIKVLGNSGYGELAPLGKAIRYAVDNGAKVINVSMVGDSDSELSEAVEYAYKKGVVIVAAMGNYNGSLDDNPMYPACSDAGATMPMVLGVSAVGKDRRLAYFSNTGSNCVDITAPGVDISSTGRYSPLDNINDSYIRGWQGTSFAAPFVAGAAALIKSVRPEWKADDIYQAILQTTQHTPAADEAAYANLYGKGLLQIHRAVALAKGLPIPPTMFDTSTPYIEPTTDVLLKSETKQKHAKTFVAIGASGQMRDGYSDTSEFGGQYERPEARAIESFASYGTGAKQINVTATVGKKGQRLISVYNSRWQLQTSWPVKTLAGAVSIAAGERDGETVIAVAPAGSDKIVYQLYSSTGGLIEQEAVAAAHRGVSVTINADLVFVAYTRGTETIVTGYKNIRQKVYDFDVTDVGVKPSIAVGQVSGSTALKIVVGASRGLSDRVKIYSVDGDEERSFSPFGDGRKSGVTVSIFDADNSGENDIVTYAANTTGLIRSWTAKAKNAGEWQAPFAGSFYLLPR